MLPPKYEPMISPFARMRRPKRIRIKEKVVHFKRLRPLPDNPHLVPHLRLSKWEKRAPKHSQKHGDQMDQNRSFLEFLKQKRQKFLKNSTSLGVEDEEKINKSVFIKGIFSIVILLNLLK